MAGKSIAEVRSEVGIGRESAYRIQRELGVAGGLDKSKAAVARRRERMRDMAAEGYSSRQIAAALGIGEGKTRVTLRELGIDVPADRATNNTHRHDANRIIAQIVMDAENLTEGVNLIAFAEVDRTQIAEWLRSLQESRDKLGTFIRRLMKEQQHGQVA